MIEVARTQDEETGDGTKSVIILGQSGLYYYMIKQVFFLLIFFNIGKVLQT